MTSRGALVRALAGAALAAGMLVSPPAQAGPTYAEPPPTAAGPSAPSAPSASPVTSGAPADGASSASSASAPLPTTEPPPAEPSRRTAWPWILMGTGVALIVTAAVFQVRAVSQDDKRESEELRLTVLSPGDPGRPALVQSIEDHDDSAKSSRTISLAVGTVGFLAVAGSVVLWFVEGSSSAPSDPRGLPPGAAGKLRPTFTPSLGPSYAGASLGASF